MAEIKMYTRSLCGYCFAAERLLKQKGLAFEEIDATGKPELRQWLVEASGGRTTLPQIFIDGKPIGGYDDLKALERSGELDLLASS